MACRFRFSRMVSSTRMRSLRARLWHYLTITRGYRGQAARSTKGAEMGALPLLRRPCISAARSASKGLFTPLLALRAAENVHAACNNGNAPNHLTSRDHQGAVHRSLTVAARIVCFEMAERRVQAAEEEARRR